ncbi:hypothetical protein HYALB_00010977 [Hymenoscyphus albidus]|uniref:LPXTG-domain-containing protein n=1 Tax=Hymenoscyphus albidus TaxID=595503 RepID=A0A9N9LSE2_9HELO|nr:hypothetical protein HYALB_00010977 [Hymenoscyphus albidus]
MMKSQISVAFTVLLGTGVLGLKVSEGSPCAHICLEGTDVSDPVSSSTLGDEIVCQDKSFNETSTGQKFKSCLNCLQNSTVSENGGNDVKWFMYNMRFALGTCLFGFRNNSDAVSSPCSTSTSCVPLQGAIEHSNLDPDENPYTFCNADSNSMMGTTLQKCEQCLQSGKTEVYLSNFLRALKGGCTQRPNPGMTLGLDSTVFTTKAVNATFTGDNPFLKEEKPASKKGLSTGAIVGIAVGLGALLVAVILISYLYCRNRRSPKTLRGLNSGFDSRFGASNITSPNSGAYGNPYSTSPPLNVAPMHIPSRSRDLNEIKDEQHWRKKTEHAQQIQLPLYSPPSQIPTHQAYIPPSPTGTHSTHFSISPHSSAKSSPEYPSHLMTPTNPRSVLRTPLSSPHSRISPRQPPPLSTLNTSRGNDIASPSVGQDRRNDFELAERERREREARGEVIAPIEKRGKRGKKKKDRSPDSAGSDMNNKLW